MSSDFERRVEQYLEYSGWELVPSSERDPYQRWSDGDIKCLTGEAFFEQLKQDFDSEGSIERAAEILEKSR